MVVFKTAHHFSLIHANQGFVMKKNAVAVSAETAFFTYSKSDG
jgi:hypothetical protein